MVEEFRSLVKSRKYLKLTPQRLVALLKEPKLNIAPEEECPLVYDWLEVRVFLDLYFYQGKGGGGEKGIFFNFLNTLRISGNFLILSLGANLSNFLVISLF